VLIDGGDVVKIIFSLIFLLIFLPSFVFSEDNLGSSSPDGTYEATVTTDTASYSTAIVSEDNQAARIALPDAKETFIYGIEDFEWKQTGINSQGEAVSIERQDSYQPQAPDKYIPDENAPPTTYKY